MPLEPGTLAELKVAIDASTRKLDKRMQMLDRNMRKTGKKIGTGFSKAFSTAIGIGSVSLAAMKLKQFVTTTFASIDALSKQSEKLGVGIVELQKYGFVAEQSGIKQSTFEMGLQRFVRRAGEAAMGTGEAKDALKLLGVQLKNADGTMTSAVERFRQAADGLSKVTDKSERLRLAFKLFDSEGVAMINMLKDGAAGMDELIKGLDEGTLVTDEQAKSVVELNDKWNKFTTNLSNKTRTVLLELAADFGVMTQEMKDAEKKLDEFEARQKAKQPGKQGPGFLDRLFGISPIYSAITAAMSKQSNTIVPQSGAPFIPPVSVSESAPALPAALAGMAPPAATATVQATPTISGVDDRAFLRQANTPSTVVNIQNANFESPEMAARKFTSQKALIPRSG